MRVLVKFEELVKYQAAVTVEPGSLLAKQLEQGLQVEDIDGSWFDLVQNQHPDWVTTACAGVVERDLVSIEPEPECEETSAPEEDS